jgi:type IV pilus assembly protein PilP
LVFQIWGCNSSADSPPKPVTVRKTIVVPSQTKQNQKKTALQKTGRVSKTVEETKPPKAAHHMDDKRPKEDKTGEKLAVAILKKVKEESPEDDFSPLYSGKGKIDPFIPLIKPKAAGQPIDGAKKRKPRTPLEKIDLSQMKLVATIRSPSGNKALVEETSGKGYIISKGTYIGLHAGRVVAILKDRLIVEEETKDILGKNVIQKRELKLLKPPGDF